MCRFFENERFNHHHPFQRLYWVAPLTVKTAALPYQDVEDLRVHTPGASSRGVVLECMRCLFALVLASAQQVFQTMNHWSPKARVFAEKAGWKQGLTSDRDGSDSVLRRISAVLSTLATLSMATLSPFPHGLFAPK